MCLASPMQIVSLGGHHGCCEAKGVRRDVSLTLLGDQRVAAPIEHFPSRLARE